MPTPTFELKKVFPADDQVRVLQVRFLIASQAMAAIGRLLHHLPSSPALSESRTYLMALYLGAAYEGALAFEEADTHGAFSAVLATGWEDMATRVDRLRIDCNEKDSQSLRKRLLVLTRNTVGFHWDPKVVAYSLSRLEDTKVAAWAGGKEKSIADTAFPLISALIRDALERWAGSKQDLDRLMQDAVTFGADLFNLAHGTYTTSLKAAGVWE